METKSNELANGWTLVAHKDFKLYSNDNSYLLLDKENAVLIQFSVQDNEFEVAQGSYDLNFKLNIGLKTVKILTEPYDEEE